MTNADWTVHTQFDSDPRRNGKLRLIRNHTPEGESHVIASNVKHDNAPLIAAAPDLLAALETLLNTPRGADYWDIRNIAFAQARAAIAKAKGQ